MKRVVLLSLSIIVVLFAANCKKSGSSKNTAYCTSATATLIAHPLDADSVMYFLPTAFTPNGDGENDVFRITYYNIVTDSSTITVWDMNGKEVYTGHPGTNYQTNSWEGKDMSGNKCPAGVYPVRVQLLTSKGAKVDVCTSITLLQYSGTCIIGNAAAYKFEDQLNTNSGFVNQTNETFCP